VSGRHHSCGAVEHRAEVVVSPKLCLAGRDPHTHRQLKRSLRGYGGVDRRTGRSEHRAHPVAGVVEDVTVVTPDRFAQHLVVGLQRGPHRIGIGLPPPR
jgi:hypothetical protein